MYSCAMSSNTVLDSHPFRPLTSSQIHTTSRVKFYTNIPPSFLSTRLLNPCSQLKASSKFPEAAAAILTLLDAEEARRQQCSSTSNWVGGVTSLDNQTVNEGDMIWSRTRRGKYVRGLVKSIDPDRSMYTIVEHSNDSSDLSPLLLRVSNKNTGESDSTVSPNPALFA